MYNVPEVKAFGNSIPDQLKDTHYIDKINYLLADFENTAPTFENKALLWDIINVK